MPKAVDLQHHLRTSTITRNVADLNLYNNGNAGVGYPLHPEPSNGTSPTHSTNSSISNASALLNPQVAAAAILHMNGVSAAAAAADNYGFLYATHSATPGSAFTAIQLPHVIGSNGVGGGGGGQPEMKYLSKMLQGYKHFLSLRKASITFVEPMPRFRDSSVRWINHPNHPNQSFLQEIPQSNFSTSKQMCRFEASLIMDTVEQFFPPFNTLKKEHQVSEGEHFFVDSKFKKNT